MDSICVRIIQALVIFGILFVLGSSPEINIAPFSIKLRNWMLGLGLALVFTGAILCYAQGYKNGLDSGYKKGIEKNIESEKESSDK